MRRACIGLSLFGAIVALAGCVFASDDWKKEYGTPELFLASVRERDCYIYQYDRNMDRGPDSAFEIRDALLAAGPYEVSTKTASTAERFFTYYNLLSNSTAGPNYCAMSVYDDGFVLIHHKSALGPHQYAHFAMDGTKATTIIDRVFEKIPYEKSVSEEDYAKAQVDGAIRPFLEEMEKKPEVLGKCIEVDNDWKEHEFTDHGEVLSLLKTTRFTPTEEWVLRDNSALRYNLPDDKEETLDWWLCLDEGFQLAAITYEYRDRIGRKEEITLRYSLDEDDGRAIYEKGMELAKR